MYNFTDYVFNGTNPTSVIPSGQDYIIVFLGIIAFCQVFMVIRVLAKEVMR